MDYSVNIIHNKDDIESCPFFEVDNFLWNTTRRPQTRGQLAYLHGRGLFVRMTCYERDPKRLATRPREIVYTDSAMEAFFSFPNPSLREQTPTPESLYLNFEVNANGVLYAKHGYGRKNRDFITEAEYAQTEVAASISPESWTMEFILPNALLNRVGNLDAFTKGSVFYCNFYKISEDPAIEHYAAFAAPASSTPNFHTPQFFARAVVV